MHIVTAIDSFKGSLSAQKAAEAIERGIRSVYPQASICNFPLADGGEGLAEAILAVRGGTKRDVCVKDPLGRDITAFYGLLDDRTAVIEMAAASGLPLLTESERNPMHATSYGTGQLIRAALDDGCKSIILGLGGSATNDGGLGMAQALGIRFLDADGKEVVPGGEGLAQVAAIDASGRDKRLDNVFLRLACDVTNPLCGTDGASHVFGGQKGAEQQPRDPFRCPLYQKAVDDHGRQRQVYQDAANAFASLQTDLSGAEHQCAISGQQEHDDHLIGHCTHEIHFVFSSFRPSLSTIGISSSRVSRQA